MQPKPKVDDKVIVIDTGEIGTVVRFHTPDRYFVRFEDNLEAWFHEYRGMELMLAKGNSNE